MTAYCDGCGNQQCVCGEISDDNYMRLEWPMTKTVLLQPQKGLRGWWLCDVWLGPIPLIKFWTLLLLVAAVGAWT